MARRSVKTKYDGSLRGSTFTDAYGRTIIRVHSISECEGRESCCIHNPSKHALREAKISVRIPGPFDIKPLHMERICEHGVGHPDPDDMLYWKSRGEESMGVHGCDGCCTPGGYDALQHVEQVLA